jgi:hypothetical protein
MDKITSLAELKVAIHLLEQKQADEVKLLKEQAQRTYESFKPMNLLKNTFKEAAASKELKDSIINTAIGLAAGFIYNLVIEKITNTKLRTLLSTALMAGITAIADKNSDSLKAFGNEILNLFKSKKEDKASEPEVVNA